MGFYGIKGYGKSNKREKNEIRIRRLDTYDKVNGLDGVVNL
jgi:hypothetical protein